jgi:D-3-phosphoglycerate dehydrogenase / 2-oxoglutarate reductase
MTEKTKNILSRENLAKTKKGVRIINCARGGLVDEEALAELLKSGHVAGAAFDVFSVEPAETNPLFTAPNVICTPHLGASTNEAQENVALQVAEQMSDYLLRGAITNAVNFPSITAEEAPRVKPFVALAEKLGAFLGQLTESAVKGIRVVYEGKVRELNTKPMTAAAIAGVLRPFLADINMVNAGAIAKDKGITVDETFRETAEDGESRIKIYVDAEDMTRHAAGTVLSDGVPRITEIRDIKVDAAFAPHMVYVRNADKPGFIGAFGSLLGEAGVNIATFNLGRDRPGGDAICYVAVDSRVDDALIERIEAIPQVKRARRLVF